MFPYIVYDNFFEDPDLVVDFANSLEYRMGDGSWPGVRTNDIGHYDYDFKKLVIDKICRLFYPDSDYQWYVKTVFQKVEGMHEDKYHIKNRGWIHKDTTRILGGIIYLDKNPEKDTGTSIYKKRKIAIPYTPEKDACKRKWYTGQDVSDEEYEKYFDSTSENYEEVLKVENVYNRLFMFTGHSHHGVHTYGSVGNTRLTLPFFFTSIHHPTFNFPTFRE